MSVSGGQHKPPKDDRQPVAAPPKPTDSTRSVSEGQPALTPEQRIEKIGQEVRHAQATRWPAGDSWIQGYAEDCGWLLAELAREREATETARYVADCVQVRLTEAEGRVRDLQEERDAAERFATHDPRVDWPSDKHGGPMDAIMAAFDRLGEALVGLPE